MRGDTVIALCAAVALLWAASRASTVLLAKGLIRKRSLGSMWRAYRDLFHQSRSSRGHRLGRTPRT